MVPLSKYLSHVDLRYMIIRAKILEFSENFLFFKMVSNGPISELKNLVVDHGINLNKSRSHGDTGLHVAVRQRLTDIATHLICWGADISLKTRSGETALQIAVKNGDLCMVQLLLGKDARPDAKYNNGTDLCDLLNAVTVDITDSIKSKILSLLKNPPLVDGPGTASSQGPFIGLKHGGYQDCIQPPPQLDGETACKAFHVTIANFFLAKGHREFFDIRTVPVHEILYDTKSPSEICEPVFAQAELAEKGLRDKGRYFSWYHVPANNVCQRAPGQICATANSISD